MPGIANPIAGFPERAAAFSQKNADALGRKPSQRIFHRGWIEAGLHQEQARVEHLRARQPDGSLSRTCLEVVGLIPATLPGFSLSSW